MKLRNLLEVEYGVHDLLKQHIDQIKLDSGPRTYRMLQTQLALGKDAWVENWLREKGYLEDPDDAPPNDKALPFEEQIKNVIKKEIGECWKSYKQVGMKKKGNKTVPNCVPKNEVSSWDGKPSEKNTGKPFPAVGETMQQGDYSAIEQGWDGLSFDEQISIIGDAMNGEARPNDIEKSFDQLKSEIPDFELAVANYLGIDEALTHPRQLKPAKEEMYEEIDALHENETYCPKCAAKIKESIREEIEKVAKEAKTKPAKGKRFAKKVKNKKTGRTRTVSYGQAGKAKKGGDRIRPGTAKGHAYCARSAKIKKCKNPPCANTLSRKKWKCQGSRSVK